MVVTHMNTILCEKPNNYGDMEGSSVTEQLPATPFCMAASVTIMVFI